MPLGRASDPARNATLDRRRRWVGTTVLLALLLLLAGLRTAQADEAGDQHQRIRRAWIARNPAGITATMRPGGTLALDLLLLERAGIFQRGQAERTLKSYFRGVSRIRLKDVTPRRGGASRRHRIATYEYAYRPDGRDPVTSILSITLERGAEDRWYLTGIRERAKRSARR